jgi:hypothetical protein
VQAKWTSRIVLEETAMIVHVRIWAVLTFLGLATVFAGPRLFAQEQRLDVNDVTFLWPVPKTRSDATNLVSLDTQLLDGSGPIISRNAFDALVIAAQKTTVINSAGLENRINFAQFRTEFEKPSTWKIVGFRIDPSAPGTTALVTSAFGSTPQLRLVAQPVTLDAKETVRIHDVTAHFVFSFVKPPVPGSTPALPAPDREKFSAIVTDLVTLKQSALKSGIRTDGKLSVHPGLGQNPADFSGQVATLIRKHLSADRLSGMAFMGLEPPEPWIFFAMVKKDGAFVSAPHPTTGSVEMLTFRGGTAVMPGPKNKNVDQSRGVSTLSLFARDIQTKLESPVFQDLPGLQQRHVPDLIANPLRAHFFNTDCVSCHTESARRRSLRIGSKESEFRYSLPPGISGVDENLLPQSDWNVRNLGWFPRGVSAVPTVTMRTANESAECADFINRQYLSIGASNKITSTQVANPLTLVMKAKSKQDLDQLKALLNKMQSLPPDKNPIAVALKKMSIVHFARFVFIGDDQLAVITTYDGELDDYLDLFVNEIGEVFNQILAHVQDAPPLPVSDNRKEFLAFVRRHDAQCVQPFYSAYPDLRVLDILTLQQSGKSSEQK